MAEKVAEATGKPKGEGDKAKGARPELRPLGWCRIGPVRVVGYCRTGTVSKHTSPAGHSVTDGALS